MTLDEAVALLSRWSVESARLMLAAQQTARELHGALSAAGFVVEMNYDVDPNRPPLTVFVVVIEGRFEVRMHGGRRFEGKGHDTLEAAVEAAAREAEQALAEARERLERMSRITVAATPVPVEGLGPPLAEVTHQLPDVVVPVELRRVDGAGRP